MKNLKTKLALTALACVFTLSGCFPFIKNSSQVEKRKDADVMRVVSTIKQLKDLNPTYKLPDGRTISIDYEFYSSKKGYIYEGKKDYFQLGISKESENAMVAIKDYELDNLDSQDEIIYCINSNHPDFALYGYASYTVKFGELPGETQEEIREQYNSVIKCAPENLLKKYQRRQQEIKQQREKQEKEMEDNILRGVK